MTEDDNSAGSPEGRFPALRSPAYRLIWIGLTISAVGTRMQDTTVRWHVYDLTHSVVALGLIGLSRFVPLLLFSLWGGAVADSLDRRKVLIITQTALAIGAVLLAVLTQAGVISAVTIYGVNALGAAALAFDSPARQALMPNLVPRKHFANAASLNSMAFQVATVVGPCIAGLLIQRGSLAIIYWINAASYIAVLIALLRIKPESLQRTEAVPVRVDRRALLDGIRFVMSKPILVWSMCLDFLATFFSSAEALLPVFAKDILHVNAAGYGVLNAAAAAGSVGAGAVMAYRPPITRQGMAMLLAVAVYGLATILFGFSHLYWLSIAALAITGASDTVSTILRQTARQMNTPDALRGRMTAVNMVFFTGGPHLGNLEAGLVARWLGAPWSVITGGIGCLIAVAWVAARAPVLRNYRQHEP